MKRDPRLQGLSSEHHHALTLARLVLQKIEAGDLATARGELLERFDAELDPHFRVEEEVLLPALRAAGESALVDRTEADHRALRSHVAAVRAGHIDTFAPFAHLLAEHVRFEERELFPCCEAKLESAVLDEVSRRSPPPGRRAS